MVKRRRKYDKEFKLMAVELMDTNKSVREISEELGVKKPTPNDNQILVKVYAATVKIRRW